MTKRDWIWVAIRIFGIYLLVEAIIAIPILISSAYLVCQHFDFGSSNTSDLDRTFRLMRQSAGTQVISSLCRLIICGGAGLYFIGGAEFLFRLICPPDSNCTDKHEV